MKLNSYFILAITAMALLNSCGKKYTETKPEYRDITETVFASGILVPENQYNLTAQSDGYLISLNFDEGDIVETGELLAEIDNETYDINLQGANQLLDIAISNLSPSAPALKQIEANLLIAERKMKQDEIQVERYEFLYNTNSVSKLEYENVLLAYETSKANHKALQENYKLQEQQAEQQLINQETQSGINKVLQGNNELRAVIGGKVYNKFKELGDYVRRGEIIAVIGSPENLYAKLSIDESSISNVRVNQQVIIQLNTNKRKNYKGTISEVYPSFDIQTQSFSCKAIFTDSLDFLMSGTQVQANIIIKDKDNVLVIPRKYLDFGNTVLVKSEGAVKVETGFISNEWVEILNGINENSIVLAEKK
ncbi:MAG: HlyD family efflux transporter periplasmic adaptor subunit [Bacteroidales bacterium]|jgi:multidrug efflux pump subunit AcrA (membrane-fusion protein)|nr:HlyD family efflux transporter periplasmic adaptor subunit [Bacteroidales bacterium]